ncbi:hypothetical protein [Phyllobacterium endophyticum]|uniref:hypothetical protein n=1 Tax=Phyllobacterium endophyticum TaxID=1149773 RepID=UPI0011CA8852|nr:hypothetical protein [Phyllobacterium endophyticum]TXR50372.1 hypothetical protein FVA77_03420 [Phyllobacterium endophyticum]
MLKRMDVSRRNAVCRGPDIIASENDVPSPIGGDVLDRARQRGNAYSVKFGESRSRERVFL